MDAIKAVVKNGRIDLTVPNSWPEGCEVLVAPLALPGERIGLDESEWRDDPAALADWDACLKTLEPGCTTRLSRPTRCFATPSMYGSTFSTTGATFFRLAILGSFQSLFGSVAEAQSYAASITKPGLPVQTVSCTLLLPRWGKQVAGIPMIR